MSTARTKLLTADQLAELLGMTRRWIYEQVDQHQLPAYRIRRTLLFDLVAVDGWLDRHRIGEWPPESCANPGPPAGIFPVEEE